MGGAILALSDYEAEGNVFDDNKAKLYGDSSTNYIQAYRFLTSNEESVQINSSYIILKNLVSGLSTLDFTLVFVDNEGKELASGESLSDPDIKSQLSNFTATVS